MNPSSNSVASPSPAGASLLAVAVFGIPSAVVVAMALFLNWGR